MKIIVILGLVAVVVALFTALVFLYRDRGVGHRVVTALAIRVAPSSVASRTIASSLSPLPSACTSVTARGAVTSAGRTASIRTTTDRGPIATMRASPSIARSGSKAVNESPSASLWTRVT